MPGAMTSGDDEYERRPQEHRLCLSPTTTYHLDSPCCTKRCMGHNMPAAISPRPRPHGTTKPYVKPEPPSPSTPPAQLSSAGPPSRASTNDVKPNVIPKSAGSAKTGNSKPGRKPRMKSAESGRPWTGEEKIQLLHFALERNGRGFGEAVPGRTASQASQTWK